MAESDIYMGRGVSSSKSEIHKAIANVDQGLFPGAFCKILPDHITGDEDSCLIMHADGAGTKSSLAYLYWKETGDISIFKGIAQDSLVMNLDDMACVGATSGFLFSNTIGRNKFLIPGDVIQTIIEGYESLIAEMETHNVKIHSCGGETADVGDLVRTLIADSTMMVRMPRKDVIDLDNVTPGDVIIGFASYGQAKWESSYNSGMGSNGLTAARHDTFGADYATKYPETFSPEVPENLVYCGKGSLTDPLEGTPLTLGQAVLSPTRTYAPLILEILEKHREAVHGFIHCSGGGQTKCLHFGKGLHYIKDNLLEIPPLFRYIQEKQGMSLKDMMPVFNMGHRLELFTPKENVDAILKIAEDCGIAAQVVGRVEESKQTGGKQGQNHLTILHDKEKMIYG